MKKSQLKEIIDSHDRQYWQNLIFQWVHDEKARELLTRVLLDNISVESIAREEQVDYKTYHLKYKQGLDQILKHNKI